MNTQWETGIAPIHYIALKGNITIIKILLIREANMEIKEEHGLTPLDMAVIQGYTKAIRLLISRRAKINHLVVRRAIRLPPSVLEESYKQQT